MSCDKDILKLRPEGASHVSIPSTLNIPLTWLRYDNDGIYSVWMDDGGANKKPYWREIPNNCIEFPECIRSINDIEQLAKANERVKELEGFYATYEREFKAVAKWAISMQNDICEGKYHSNTPEGMIYSESTWVDCRWQDVTGPLFTSHEGALNKFAIEKKIEAINEALNYYEELKASEEPIGAGSILHACLGRLVSQQEQLRKEQNQC